MLLYIDKVATNRTAFESKVREVSARLGVVPDWLMLVMFIESGLNHSIVNRITKATGLIQFMPDTQKALKTTQAALQSMSNVQQLDYVYKYLSPHAGKLHSYLDLYLAVFFPLSIGMPLDSVVESRKLSAGLIAKQNSGYDLNHDGKITLAEIAQSLLKRVPGPFASAFQLLKNPLAAGGLLFFVGLVGAAFLLLKR